MYVKVYGGRLKRLFGYELARKLVKYPILKQEYSLRLFPYLGSVSLYPQKLACRPGCRDLGLTCHLVHSFVSEMLCNYIRFLGCSVVKPNDSGAKRISVLIRKYQRFALSIYRKRVHLADRLRLFYLALYYRPIALGIKLNYVAVCVKRVICRRAMQALKALVKHRRLDRRRSNINS